MVLSSVLLGSISMKAENIIEYKAEILMKALEFLSVIVLEKLGHGETTILALKLVARMAEFDTVTDVDLAVELEALLAMNKIEG